MILCWVSPAHTSHYITLGILNHEHLTEILCSFNQLFFNLFISCLNIHLIERLHRDELGQQTHGPTSDLCPHDEPFFFFSNCSPLQVSSGSGASPTFHFAVALRNQSPSPLRPRVGQDVRLEMAPTVALPLRCHSWIQLRRRRWTTWVPCVLALPATSAPVRATHTWVHCPGY